MPRSDDIYKLIGENIKIIRRARKMTQEELARFVGLKRASVVHIEKGITRIPVDRLYFFAAALNCSIFELLPKALPVHKRTIKMVDESSRSRLAPGTLDSVLSILNDLDANSENRYDERSSYEEFREELKEDGKL